MDKRIKSQQATVEHTSQSPAFNLAAMSYSIRRIYDTLITTRHKLEKWLISCTP